MMPDVHGLRRLLPLAIAGLTLSGCAGDGESAAAREPAMLAKADAAAPSRTTNTSPPAIPDTAVITVYKSATCGCCAKWVDHLRANGFRVDARDTDNMGEVKLATGVPARLRSCHTAVIGPYVVEGHVPADVIRRLLEERPAIAGLAVPGMPMGSPGMEGPNLESYDVLAFEANGETSVFATR
ncbi:MAG: DUF411 domain-containing protein [Gemmatimonadaceae bacterium]